MKRHIILPGMLLAAVLVLHCKTISTTSIVHRDGSFERIITISGDSTDVQDVVYPFPTENGWTTALKRTEPTTEDSIRQDTINAFTSSADKDSGETQYEYSTKKRLTPNAFNSAFFNAEDSVNINIQVHIKKQFRWFYTFYMYTETYFRFFPFDQIPMSEYVSKEEIERFVADKDSADIIEDKIELWSQQSIFTEYMQVLLDRPEELKQMGISTAQVEEEQDDLFELIQDYNFETADFSAFFLEHAATLWGEHVLQFQDHFSTVDKKFKDWFSLIEAVITEDYVNTVIMPGQIIDTNAHAVQVDKASWEFGPDHFQFLDFRMHVESREWNTIPFVASLLFIVFALVVIYKSRKRTQRKP